MRKKILMITCIGLCLLLGTYSLAAQELVFFYNANLITQSSPGESDYSRDPGYSFVNSSDKGNIASVVSSYPFGSSFGVGYLFNRHLGVTVSMSFFENIKLDLTSNYTLTWQFPEEPQHTQSLTWTNPGNISIKPINLNLTYAHYLWRNTIINVTAGASLFLTSVNLTTNIGYGVGGQYIFYKFVDPNLKKVTVSLVDCYELELKQEEKNNIFGANVGLNIEQRFTEKFSAFAGFCYYFAPKKTSTWELIPEDNYRGYFNALDRTIKEDRSNLPDISHVNLGIKISYFSVVVGIKLHIKLK
jgi:hypothetical protein